MTTKLPKIKKLQLITLFVIFMLGIALVTAKSCRLTDRYSELSGQYDILTAQREANNKELLRAIYFARGHIDNLKVENTALEERVELTNKQLLNKNVRLIQLGSDLVKAKDSGDTDAIIFNLEEQVSLWKVKFTLAEKIISDKDIIIFNLKKQYDSQLSISIDFEKMYLGEKDLRGRSEVLLGITKRKLRTSRVGGTLKNVAVVALGAIIAFKIVK